MEWTCDDGDDECETGKDVSIFKDKNKSEAECSKQATLSFTGDFEDLTIDCDAPKKRKMYGSKSESCTVSTGNNVSNQKDTASRGKFLMQDENTTNLYNVGPEILQHQGSQYSSDDVAPVWKKDCRMWLWKGTHYSRKKRRPYSQTTQSNLKS